MHYYPLPHRPTGQVIGVDDVVAFDLPTLQGRNRAGFIRKGAQGRGLFVRHLPNDVSRIDIAGGHGHDRGLGKDGLHRSHRRLGRRRAQLRQQTHRRKQQRHAQRGQIKRPLPEMEGQLFAGNGQEFGNE